MKDEVHRDSLSAWLALREAGGLEVEDRDKDLVTELKERLDRNAPDLRAALANTPLSDFLRAFFLSVQPFTAIFKDILDFFTQAGARYGKSHWRLSVGDEFLELSQFEEFLEHWNSVGVQIEVPALDIQGAFILNNVRLNEGGFEYLTQGMSRGTVLETGLPDVDEWLTQYDAGHYAPFPGSLYPENFPPGLKDIAGILLAAVTIVRQRGFNRAQMLAEHVARNYASVMSDALHPWTIAQNETDFWLRSQTGFLANLLRRPESERKGFAAKMVEALERYPRRRVPVEIRVSDLERLLSLPVWQQRYEAYGVWVATRIIGALDDHEVVINAPNAELKFGFGETRLADIDTARPKLSLYAERRVALANPVGKSRKEGAQPDFSLWTQDIEPSECPLVVEVKHYKKRSKRNFRDALVDYGRAHPKAEVVLVNYGHAGADFDDLPPPLGSRCRLLGNLAPFHPKEESEFRDLVRACVGMPTTRLTLDEAILREGVVAIDVSASMRSNLESAWFWTLVESGLTANTDFALIDHQVKGFASADTLRSWFAVNSLGSTTSLAEPVSELLEQFRQVVVVTDQDGLESLAKLNCRQIEAHTGSGRDGVLAHVVR